MRLKYSHVVFLIIIIIVGGIYIAKGFGLWSTESDKVPIKISEGTGAGTYDPFDIRGSYSFGEISSLFDIDIKLLAEAFQLGDIEVAKDLKSKDLETLFGEQEGDIEIGNESVQVFVAIMKELDIKDSDAFLPMSAVQVLLEVDRNRSNEVLDYLENHQVEAFVNGAIPEVESQPEAEGLKVNGNTTFSQVLGFGISVEEIESILDAKMPPENQSVKSYCTENGLSFSVVKEALNALITP